MKKSVMALLLLGILLIFPLVQAQTQTQTYSGFGRFVDNAKMFFSSGDNKVRLALEIREKEVDSAIINTQNGDAGAMSDNLENAWKKLQVVQEKVSVNTAEEVKENSNELQESIMGQEDLPSDFEVYALEEEKTGLTAEWVVEINGKEGQTLEREVEVVMGEDDGQNRVWEIETRIDEIDGEIANWVVENSVGKEGEGNNGLTWEVKTEIAKGDNGLKPEVKTYMDVVKNNVIDKPSMTKDNEDVVPTPNIVDDDMCEEGEENCNNDDMATGPQGIIGSQDDGPGEGDDTVDSGVDNVIDGGDDSGSSDGDDTEDDDDGGEDSTSDDGGDSAPITGEVIRDSNSNNLLKKIFDWLF